MVTAIVRPFDDNEIVEVYLADHETKGNKDFEKDWLDALERAKKDGPEIWCLDDAITILETFGWKLLNTSAVKVTY